MRTSRLAHDDDGGPIMVEIPRSALIVTAAPPAVLHQLNQEAVTGLTRRLYLEQVSSFESSGGTVGHRGKLRVVESSAFVAFLMRGAPAAPSAEPPSAADALAAELGLVVGGAR